MALAGIEDQNLPQEETAPVVATPQLTKAPELLQFIEADYPLAQLEANHGGSVLMAVDIDALGHVQRVELLSATDHAFIEPAMTALTQFLFSPAEIDGVPATIRIEYRYLFKPEAPAPDVLVGEPTGKFEPKPINLRGQVLEAGTRLPVRDASIVIAGRPVAQTNAHGKFFVRGVPEGEVALKITSPFHGSYEGEENIARDEVLEVSYYVRRLDYDPYLTVVRTKVKRREASRVRLEQREVNRVPGTGGDPIRVIENLPGMARAPGGLGGVLLVRGAEATDSRVLIDGVEVPLLYHFGGLTSVVNASMLDSIDFYPGGFGVRYGNAIGGIVAVESRELNCTLLRGSLDVSVLHTAVSGCIPLEFDAEGEAKKNGWKLAFAGRRSYIDVLLPPILDAATKQNEAGILTLVPIYYDYQLKLGKRYNTVLGSHRFSIFAFGSNDRFELLRVGTAENTDFQFNSEQTFHRVVIRDQWRVNDKFSINSQITPGVTLSDFSASSSDTGLDAGFDLSVKNLLWREDLTYTVNSSMTLRGGLDWQMGASDFSVVAPLATEVGAFPGKVFDFTRQQEITASGNAFNHAYWVEGEIKFNDLTVVPGFRLNRWDFYHTQDFSYMPRLALRYGITENTVLKAAYGVYEKLPEPNQLVDGFGNPSLPPSRSQHFILGYEHTFTDLIDLDIQGFYNLRDNIPEETHAQTAGAEGVRSERWNADGSGYTMGLEFLLRHKATQPHALGENWTLEELLRGRFNGWIAYTLSKAITRNSRKEEFPSQFDQTHILTVVAQAVLPWGLEAGLRFRLVTGNPFTPREKQRKFVDTDLDRYRTIASPELRRTDRASAFHQLDLRLDKTWTYDLWKLSLYLEILNVYNRKNVERVEYDYRYRQRANLTLLPILPVLGIKGEF